MKMQRIVGRLSAVAVTGLLLGAESASADISLLSYNFDNLPPGALAGQDGFSKTLAWPGDLTVAAGPVGSVNTSNCVYLNNTNGISDNELRPIASPLVFTGTSPLIYQSVQVYSGSTGGAYASLTFAGGPSYFPLFGLAGDTRTAYIRDSSGNASYGPAVLAANQWYEFKLAMDFSVDGGTSTLAYRNLTAGETAFTAITGLSNIPLALPKNSNGEYVANAWGIRIDGNSTTIALDNFAVSEIPEPTAATLLLTGLLVCAWRKRN